MGYKADKSLEDLFPADFVDRAAPKIADAVGEHLHKEVVRRTPVAEPPEAYHGNVAQWIEDRGGRLPSHLKKSWHKTDSKRTLADTYEISVETEDLVAPHVEWDTMPHLIKPKVPFRISAQTGKMYRSRLRVPYGPRFVFPLEVHHPGTTGQHMMRDSLADVELRWVAIAEKVLDEFITEMKL